MSTSPHFAKHRCPGCGEVFAGRANKIYCSDRCRNKAYLQAHPKVGKPEDAVNLLANLPERKFRDVVRMAIIERETSSARDGEPPAARGRLRIRWRV